MYEKPHLTSHHNAYRIDIIEQHARVLLDELQKAGFKAERLEGTLGYEDLNGDVGREEVVSIELPSTTDRLAIRKFLRDWHA